MNTNKKWPSFSNITTLGRLRLLAFLSAVAIVFTLASTLLSHSNLIKDWENRFQSRYYLIRSHFSEPVVSELPLVIVLIDDHSLPVNSPRSPIDRKWLADLVDHIDRQKPVLVALNILLDRPGNKPDDLKLKSVFTRYGNIILRDDPFYPVFPLFADAALDRGTVRFKLDSSDTIQEVCRDLATCQSPDIFYRKVLDFYRFATGKKLQETVVGPGWLKINFALTAQDVDNKQIRSFPVLRAYEAMQMPDHAFRDKIVLIGTGFPDLYPLYRAPLSNPEIMLQETEVIAQVLNMVASENYLVPASQIVIGGLMLLLMGVISLLIVYRGIIAGLVSTVLLTIAWFLLAGWAFAFHNLEVTFVLPVVTILNFYLAATLIYAIQERFFRLTTELHLKQAKIDFLTNELHSHHLFNEFSRLSVMIQHDPKSAKDYLVEFAEMLRSSLKFGDQKIVPVRVQVDYLNSYLHQQRMIFGDKIVFESQMTDNLDELSAPWHMFFPLVENAVKYTDGCLKQNILKQAVIRISLEVDSDFLIFSVSNPFASDASVFSSGTGLKNLKERLTWAYPEGGYSLESTHDDQFWTAELRLPIRGRTR